MKHRRGFTLIEILVSVTIVAILSVIGVVSFNKLNQRSRDAKRRSDLEQVRSALEMYRSDKGFYPDTGSGFNTMDVLGDTLVSTYLPSVPTDPKSTAGNTIPYYYQPTGLSGTNYYGYCICGNLESLTAEENNCPGVTLPSLTCNYGLKNP